jgi:DNA-binding transcriptional MerR regulator
MSDDTFTISELASVLEEKVRTVQFWADSGVIRPVRASNRRGKGTIRRFTATELKLARVAHRLALTNSPIGEIREVVDTIRASHSSQALEVGVSMSEKAAAWASKLADKVGPGGLNETQAKKICDAFAQFVVLMSNLYLAVSHSGPTFLVISYFREHTEVNRRILFWPADQSAQLTDIAKVGLQGFLGFKTLVFNAEEELRLFALPSDLEDRLRKDPASIHLLNMALSLQHQSARAGSASDKGSEPWAE